MRWSKQRPVLNGIQLQAETWKQSAATGILNGLALDYLSTINLVVGLAITFLILTSVWRVLCEIDLFVTSTGTFNISTVFEFCIPVEVNMKEVVSFSAALGQKQ